MMDQPKLRLLAGEHCSDLKDCPAFRTDDAGRVYVTGELITEPELLAQLGIGPGEAAVAIPSALLLPAAEGLGART